MKHFLIVSTWFSVSITTLLTSLWVYSHTNSLIKKLPEPTQSAVLGASVTAQPHLAYAAIPDVVTELRTAIKSADARAVVIEKYLSRYQSPMIGMGSFIVVKSDELGDNYNVDPTYLAYLTIAIAQNESNLGKRMPPNCHNAWGYGIHSDGTLCFDSWEEGISRFMNGVAEDFIAKRGLETPEEIMTRYTPHSPNGAWAKSVSQFLDDLYEGSL